MPACIYSSCVFVVYSTPPVRLLLLAMLPTRGLGLRSFPVPWIEHNLRFTLPKSQSLLPH